jgi:uncharacterized protein (TIGR00251 family)
MAKTDDALKAYVAAQNGAAFNIYVTPKAAANKIILREKADENTELRVYVTCAPENGKANKAVINALSKALGISKSAIKIVRGETTRTKTIQTS